MQFIGHGKQRAETIAAGIVRRNGLNLLPVRPQGQGEALYAVFVFFLCPGQVAVNIHKNGQGHGNDGPQPCVRNAVAHGKGDFHGCFGSGCGGNEPVLRFPEHQPVGQRHGQGIGIRQQIPESEDAVVKGANLIHLIDRVASQGNDGGKIGVAVRVMQDHARHSGGKHAVQSGHMNLGAAFRGDFFADPVLAGSVSVRPLPVFRQGIGQGIRSGQHALDEESAALIGHAVRIIGHGLPILPKQRDGHARHTGFRRDIGFIQVHISVHHTGPEYTAVHIVQRLSGQQGEGFRLAVFGGLGQDMVHPIPLAHGVGGGHIGIIQQEAHGIRAAQQGREGIRAVFAGNGLSGDFAVFIHRLHGVSGQQDAVLPVHANVDRVLKQHPGNGGNGGHGGGKRGVGFCAVQRNGSLGFGLNAGQRKQALPVRAEQPAVGQRHLQDGFAAPQGMEYRRAVFIGLGRRHRFSSLGSADGRAGQRAFPVRAGQCQGQSGGGHSAHGGQAGGHIHLHRHGEASFAGNIAQQGSAGIGEHHALRQGKLQLIFSGLEALEGIHALAIGLGGAGQAQAGRGQGDDGFGQARFVPVPFAVVIGVKPDFSLQGAGAHHAHAHADGFLGGQGEGGGNAGIVLIGQDAVIERVDFLPQGADHIMIGQGDPQPVGAGGELP